MISFLKLTVLATLFSVVSTSGHIVLVLTSSNDCDLQLNSNYSESHILNLAKGEDQTVTFHPKTDMNTLELTFSVNDISQTHVFELEFDGQEQRDVYVFSEIVILVQSIFKCDKGFSGYRCQQESSTTPSSTTTTPTTVTTTTEASTYSPIYDALHIESTNINFSIAVLTVVVVVLVILIGTVAVACFIQRRRQNIYLEPEISCESQESTKDIPSKVDDGMETQLRYTSAPSKSTLF